MKYLIFITLLHFSNNVLSQDQPLWNYTYPGSYVNASPSKSGKILALFQEFDPNCSSFVSGSILLDPSGNLIWRNCFDTTNFCITEQPFVSTVIEGSVEKFSINSNVSFSPDSGFTITYNRSGNFLSKYYSGTGFSFIGNMNDDYLYSVQKSPFIFSKSDSLGNSLWALPENDSISVTASQFCNAQKKILTGCGDYSQSDNFSRFIVVDTTGEEINNFIRNVFVSQYEYPVNVWLTPDYKILAIVQSQSFQRHAILIDTSGNLIWESPDIINYRESDYDSVYNRLHILTYYTSPSIEACYKIDASTGFTIDSLLIDSFSNPFASVKVDNYGYTYIGYRQTNTSANYRIERYKPDYSLDWIGEIYDTLGPGPFNDIFINDSGFVYLIHSNAGGTMISKFAPPIIDDINKNDLPTQIRLFPNPVSSSVNYIFPSFNEKACKYVITDIQGKIVMEGKCNSTGKGEIDIHNLSPSVYLISIQSEKGEMISRPQKIIKL